MPVDSFKFLPRLIATFYQMLAVEPQRPLPWTPLAKPLADCTVGLVTSAGLYHAGVEPPFDTARERQEPTWGDPTYRAIPAGVRQAEIGVSHLHLNPAPLRADFNIALPIQRLHEMAAAGRIGGVAERHFAFMGYQGFPPDAAAWRDRYGPEVAARFKAQGVDCVLLTPT